MSSQDEIFVILRNRMKKAKLVIIGSGPAGYTSAIYAARANLEPIVFEGFFSGPAGGQLMTTTEVENFPGFPEGITGPALMDNFRNQALKFGTEMITEDVIECDFSKYPYIVKSSNHEVEALSIIIATGATAQRLFVPGTLDGEFWQKGVTACAVCDGAMPIFRNKDLFVFGGGDTAVEEALFLTKYASKVYIVLRRDQFRASKIMTQRALSHPKIEVIYNHVLNKVEGDSVVRSVILEDLKSKELKTMQAGGVFFAIGHKPNVDFLPSELDRHENGYLKVTPGTSQTNVEGVFAAGDVQDHVYRQAITAAGSGCMAALEAERWLAAKEI
jgi:thioredoxin reductase (NADPH)